MSAVLKPLDPPVISVSQLNARVRRLIEEQIPLLWVAGEVSGFKAYPSGHWYFTLKDASPDHKIQAQVSCVMFGGFNRLLRWTPRDGMQVEVRGRITLFESRGSFQINVESMREAGLGALYEKFLLLKSRLAQEGLFDSARKRPLPFLPERVGIVTSTEAAALQDVLRTLRRRLPSLPVVVYPTSVQGKAAPAEIAAALGAAGRHGVCDVLIVCRGGGSMEDLWAFNEEIVARAIAASRIPVVSGVGHESDETIADHVADLRASTPTAAAELVAPERDDLLQRLDGLWLRLGAAMSRRLQGTSERLERIGRDLERFVFRLNSHRLGISHLERLLAQAWRSNLAEKRHRLDALEARLLHPAAYLVRKRQMLNFAGTELERAWSRTREIRANRLTELHLRLERAPPELAAARRQLDSAGDRLGRALEESMRRRREALIRLDSLMESLNPDAVLARGYARVHAADGGIVRSAGQLQKGDAIHVHFAEGSVEAQVEQVKPHNQPGS